MQFHVAIADNVPGSPSGEYTVTAGQTATFTIDSPGPDDLYTEGTAVPLLNGGYVRWAYVYNVLPNSLTVTLSPPASVQAGGYTLDVNLCGCFFNTSERGGGNGDICEVVAPLEVEQAAAPQCTLNFQYRGSTSRSWGWLLGTATYTLSTCPPESTRCWRAIRITQDTLLAQVTPNGLPADNKATDSSAGSVSGPLSAARSPAPHRRIDC